MAILSPAPAMQDLKVKFQLSTLVFPSQETQEKTIFLPNIDQLLNYSIPTAHFFSPNPDFSPETVTKKFKMALEKVLEHYYFMAGRIKLNNKSGSLEIDCNGAGAGFVVASSEYCFDEIREYLVNPNLGFGQLAVQKLENLGPEVEQPLCVFQVTSFKCGGFAIGMSMNHILFDGLAAKTFMENLASQAFDDNKPLPLPPYNDRKILAARFPPRVQFPHVEYLKLDLPIGEGSTPPVFDCIPETLEYRIFNLSSTHINHLKTKAKNITNNFTKNQKITTFGVTAALLWRCKVLSCNNINNNDDNNNNNNKEKDRISTLIIAINIKPRLNPPLPASYSGNAVLPIGVLATYEELKNGPFFKLVDSISEGAGKMTDEYARSALDWLEIQRGIPHGDYVVSSWLRLGFEEVVYPWGKAVYSCPVVNHRKDICWVFGGGDGDGVNAMVALPAEEMKIFEALFMEFIA